MSFRLNVIHWVSKLNTKSNLAKNDHFKYAATSFNLGINEEKCDILHVITSVVLTVVKTDSAVIISLTKLW